MREQNIKIDYFFDPICPYCYIGYCRLTTAIEQAYQQDVNLKITLKWRCFQLNPDMPAIGMDRKDYLIGKFGSEAYYQQAYAPVFAASLHERLNMQLEMIKRTPSTKLAHLLLKAIVLELNEAASASEATSASEAASVSFVQNLFNGYFKEGKDIGDAAILSDYAKQAGLDSSMIETLLSGENKLNSQIEAELQEDRRIAHAMQITGVPFAIINDKYTLIGAQMPTNILTIFNEIIDTIYAK